MFMIHGFAQWLRHWSSTRSLKSYCSISEVLLEFNIYKSNILYLLCWRTWLFCPHSTYEIHRFASSYCRFMLFHGLLGENKGFYMLDKIHRYVFALVRYHLNLRSTRLGFAEPEVEEGSCLIVGLVSKLICR